MLFTHWFQYNYLPAHEVWYRAADWPNASILLLLAPASWVWSRTRFWPLRPLKHILAHVRHHTDLIEEIHHLAHTGEPHPRVQARLAAGEHPTPKGPSDHA